MTQEEALNIQLRALNAIKELNAISALALDWKGDPALQPSVVHAEHPDLSDLKDMEFTQFDHLFRK